MPILDAFISDLRDTVSDGQAAVQSVVENALVDHERFAAALQTRSKPWFFVAEETLTVFCTDARPGSASAPHDHGVWSVIGCFAGAEEGWWHREEEHPQGKRLNTIGSRVLRAGDVHSLAGDAIHHVMNRWNVPNGIVHVYGGNFLGLQRSIWDPVTSERHVAGLTEPLAPLSNGGGVLSIAGDAAVETLSLMGTAFAAIVVDDVKETSDWMAKMLNLKMLANQNDTCAIDEQFTYLIDPSSFTAIGIHGRDDADASLGNPALDHLSFRISSIDELRQWQLLLASRGAEPSEITSWAYGTFVEVIAPGNVRIRLVVLKVAR
jgi:predicted metal-dependent enzyme (double-stranded beta helix superfamily)